MRDDNINEALTDKTKEVAAKAAEKGFGIVKNAVGKTVKTASNNSIKTATKTSVKTAKKSAKIAAKTSKKAVTNTVKATQKSVSASVSAFAKAAASLSNPIGLIIALAAVLIIVLIIFFYMLSGTTSLASTTGAVFSPLSWLFGGSGSSASVDDLREEYEIYVGYAESALAEAKNYTNDTISEIEFGSRDTLVFNDTVFYPASSAWSYIQSAISNVDFSGVQQIFDVEYDATAYFIQMCYIYKLRTEREAQGLSENEVPEITLTEEDMYSFLVNYYLDLEITVTGRQSCPTADCTETSYTHPAGYCPDVDDDDEDATCPGHTIQFCPGFHKKITINFHTNDYVADELEFTDEEKTMLETGCLLLESILGGFDEDEIS